MGQSAQFICNPFYFQESASSIHQKISEILSGYPGYSYTGLGHCSASRTHGFYLFAHSIKSSTFAHAMKRWWHSSVGRAKDWKSLCPWFDSRCYHIKATIFLVAFFYLELWDGPFVPISDITTSQHHARPAKYPTVPVWNVPRRLFRNTLLFE